MEKVRARGWCFTINNYDEADENFVFELAQESRYVCCGKEVGESGTPHLQGFVYFVNARSLSAMKIMHDTAHWEPMRGTAEQAATYCKKEGDYFEHGNLPTTSAEAGRQSLQERWALAKEGKFEELPPEFIKTYEYIHRKYLTTTDRPTLDNIWLSGPSGCGKSRWVRDNHEVFYTKGMSKWWDGYAGEDVVLLDDFDPTHGKFLAYYLKIWADHYAFNAEVKGGMLKIRPKLVIVTSQYHLRDCFETPEDKDAIERRFKQLTWNEIFKQFC